MRAAVVHGPRQMTIEEVPDPEPGPGEVVVAVAANGLCGSDLHLYDGEWSLVRYPVIPGHEFAGEVMEVGADVDRSLVGRRMAVDPSIPCGSCDHCRAGRGNLCRNLGAFGLSRPGGCASHATVGVDNLVPLPDSLPFEAAAVAQPLACAVHALRRAEVAPGERVLVVGGGAAGLLLAQAARAMGAGSVAVCEPITARRLVAAELELDGVFAGVDEALAAHPEKFSLVVDATGKASVLPVSLTAADVGATLLLFGVCAQGEAAAIEPVTLYERELKVVASRGLNATHQAALALLASGRVRWEPLVTDRHLLGDLPDAMGRLRRGEGIKAVTVAAGATR